MPDNIIGTEDEDHSPAWEFRIDVETAEGWPLFVQGRYNPVAEKLTYALILKTEGRIYALDLGTDHRNPQGEYVGDKHKHRWSERYRDKDAYVPEDVKSPPTDPVSVWKEFCTEAGIHHEGSMHPPPKRLGEWW